MKILVTGAAGFIGYHLSKRLLLEGHEVLGLDNLNHYYDVRLKLSRLNDLGIDSYEIAMGKLEIKSQVSGFRFFKMDLVEDSMLMRLFEHEGFDVVFNMAAQAGVRYSIDNPRAYVESNLVGFANLLEACRQYPVDHLVFASSSSVYGNSQEIPFKVSAKNDSPVSFYAATKKSNELMAYAYSHLYNIPTTGLRFFTVYGEWGRPDMAAMIFADALLHNKVIKVFNGGNLSRDFTYIDDIIEGVVRVMHRFDEDNKGLNITSARYKIYNIGNSKPVMLMDFIHALENAFGRKALLEMYPMQPGDVKKTYADVSELVSEFGYCPTTSIQEGIAKFANWYIGYYDKMK